MGTKYFACALIALLCVITVGASANVESPFVLNDDVLALIVLKADLIDPTSALRSWTEDDNSPCNWTGVTCDTQTGRVISVQLHELSLSGRIGRCLEKLSYLQIFSLANNNISGPIPSEIAQLSQLRKLDLSHNVLSGSIPPALGNLSSLKSLDLSGNALSGTLPEQLFSNSLRVLDLSFNGLTGVLPSTMRALTSLSDMDLSHNSLSGPLPDFQPYMVNVKLQQNFFNGRIPAEIGNCSVLKNLDLSHNFLTDSLPDSMQRLEFLSTLNIASNYFAGPLPSWLQSLTLLKEINLSRNAFYGQIPSTVGLLKYLYSLDMSHNNLDGSIPSTISRNMRLKELDLSSNNFTGSFPSMLMSSIVSLKLSDNQLSGPLPDMMNTHCDTVQHIDLSKNRFSGQLQYLGLCENIHYLNVSHNLFSGSIPDFQEGSALFVLDMSHNELVGDIPRSIENASGLSILLLNNNKLSGRIPPELANCSYLIDINLSQNDLLGSIPPEFGNLTNLKALDLSYNNISGVIPSELGELHNLKFFNASYNQLEGPIPEEGNFDKFNKSAFVGNIDLCGANVEVDCPNVMPKPIVLNPNSSDSDDNEPNPFGGANHHRHIALSASAILAIAAAVAISGGVVVILVLNVYSHSLSRPADIHMLEGYSTSSSPDLPLGKLVMFSKNLDPKSEEWVTSAHALLNKDSELGRGGFGTVYKAVLADGRTVAIKKLMVSSLVKSQYDFEKEIQFLGQIKHRNLLALQGYYWTPQLQLLIYDYIPNGNLYSHLHERSHGDVPLGWPARFKIALGAAHGLAHLHHACHPQVIHYNMKSSNVLLDEGCNPKIADFGLANLLPMVDRYLMSSKFQSALGYMAPEFACQSSRINEKCDVYGYGIMLLELVTGRRPVEYMEDDVVILCDYVRALLDEGNPMICVDGTLHDYVEEEVLPVIKLGLICASQVPSNRPSMAEVVQILELIKSPVNSKDLL
ncbi:hypothetical protein KP509_16G016600 [Ceratopteris richardii]|uniref:Protein kinase domain-containing protein n=1 Tax=Ceratopteris richardii TaxID=49495 RepID=A0A8T2SWZ8_CERRI|nr:hypothetical protein KP509_16G016600 [Ceratopteris richardii]